MSGPSCILCGHPQTKDVTPDDATGLERQYECAHCRRRFAVKTTPPATDKDDTPR